VAGQQKDLRGGRFKRREEAKKIKTTKYSNAGKRKRKGEGQKRTENVILNR